MKATTVLLAGLLASGAVSAAEPSLRFYHGENDNYERSGLSLRFGPLWERKWGAWTADIRPEIEVSRFHYSGPSDGPSRVWQGGAVGMLRVARSEGGLTPYGEVGLGGSMFSHSSLGPKDFSTIFQFSEHLGAGVEFGRFTAGWRYSHFSNAGIRKPNNGVDVHQFVLGASF